MLFLYNEIGKAKLHKVLHQKSEDYKEILFYSLHCANNGNSNHTAYTYECNYFTNAK